MAPVAYRSPVHAISSLVLALLLTATAGAQGGDATPPPNTDTDTVADTGTDADTVADTGADADADADAGADTAAPVVTTTPAPSVLPPKIAVVIAGDPDAVLQSTAAEIQGECIAAGLSTPTDPALRAAMRGEPGSEGDGLEELRSIRRGLGLNPRKDLASYKRIGTIAGADALVVLRREGAIKLEVFDVSAGQFYEGALDVDKATPQERAQYIEVRAKTAQERWNQAPVATSKVDDTQVGLDGQPTDEPEKKRWIKKAWPYFVVGALLIGGVTYLIVDGRRTNDPGPPLLRFRPGDE